MNLFAISPEQGWQIVGWTMVYFLAVGTAVALVGGMVRFACRRASPQLRYAISLTTFALVALLPFGIAGWMLATTEPIVETTALPREPSPIAEQVPALEPMPLLADPNSNLPALDASVANLTPATTPTLPPSTTYELPDIPAIQSYWHITIQWLPWVWIVGAPFTFLLLSTGLIGSQRMRRQSQPMASGPIADACARICAAIGVGRRVTVAICDRIASPLMIGVFRPMILLPPAAVTGWSPEEIEMVLLHELAHVRRWDNLVNLLQRLAEAVLFYHPAVWLLSQQVRRDREECCDAVVVQHTSRPQAYAELLVSLAAVGLRPPLAGMAMARHPLAQRVRRILNLEEERMKVSRSTLGLVAAALLAVYLVVLWQPIAESQAEETPTKTEEKENAKPGKETETLVINLPEHLQSETELNRFLKILEQQGYKTTYSRDSWQITVIVPKSPKHSVVLEEYLDGVRPRVLMLGGSEYSFDPSLAYGKYEGPYAPYGGHVNSVVRAEYVMDISIPPLSNDRQRKEIFRETHKALLDSPYILNKAIEDGGLQSLPLLQNAKPNALEWLRQNLEVRFPSDGVMRVKLRGPHDQKSQLKKIVCAVFESYREDVGRQKEALAASSPFLSLKEQKAADLAYKMLGMELEKLDEEQLERVKKMDFEGGLLVGNSKGHAYEENYRSDPFSGKKNNPLQSGDLLVGLHAWPVTSLSDVTQILQREDIGELSPLKFYVIRRQRVQSTRAGEFNESGYGRESNSINKDNDKLVTGRIRVEAIPIVPTVPAIVFNHPTQKSLPYSSTAQSPSKPHQLRPGDVVKIKAANVFPDAPIDGTYQIESMGTVALGPQYGRVKIAGMDLLKAEEEIFAKLKQVLKDPQVQLTLQYAVPSAPVVLPYSVPPPATQSETTPPTWFGGPVPTAQPNENRYPQNTQPVLKSDDSKAKIPKKEKPIKAIAEHHSQAEKNREAGKLQAELAKKEMALQKQRALQAKLESDRQKLDQARMEFQRVEKLANQGQVSKVSLQKSKAKQTIAQLQVQKSEALLQDYEKQAQAEGPTPSLAKNSGYSWEYRKRVAELEFGYAERALDVQKKHYSRIRKLSEQASVPAVEVMEAKLNLERANLVLERAKLEREECIRQAEKEQEQEKKTELHYNGKSFEEWRTQWKSELKIENRIEAVKAMAAFGRTGYGQQAAEAIFEVAQEYDFNYTERNEKQLYEEIEFTLKKKIEPSIWFPMLKEKYHQGPQKWRRLVYDLVPPLKDPKLRPAQIDLMLELLSAYPQYDSRVLSYLIALDRKLENSKIASIFQKQLSSENYSHQQIALFYLVQNSQMSKEVLQVYLNGAPELRKHLRTRIQSDFKRHNLSALRSRALDVLRSTKNESELRDTIRLLAVMTERAKEAQPELEKLLKHESLEIRLSAAVALELITNRALRAETTLAGSFPEQETPSSKLILRSKIDQEKGKL